ncbi:hypothetical protein OIU84_027202 [Salix udensis]|uniref:Protein WVD2-like 7 n=1 Tax=Salix udensis TaxID=889485 RepID=A0AAD6KEU6_9ROSI|nr:hypothetical protein OIU84_027202 [Salix udensis]
MATEADNLHHHRHQNYGDKWSCLELSPATEESQDVSISQIMDCDSISFGRYASDTLAWEKYSAFSHNRCQEELEKFKAPGLVAQKKAYFEEYYKKIRVMKASKEEIKPSNTCQEESVADVHGSKEENKHSNDYKIHVLDSHTTDIVNPSTGGINDGAEEDSYFDGNSSRARKDDEKSSKTTQKESPVRNEVEHGGSQLKKQGSSVRAKGNVSSAANRTKLDCRISKDVVKRSQKPNPSVCREIKRREDVSLASGKRITSKPASNIKSDRVQSRRQLSEEVYVKQVQLPKAWRTGLPATSSVITRSAQRSSKDITNISRLRKISVDKRSSDGFGQSSLGLSGHHSLPKSKESGNQGPKVMLKNLSDRSKSNQNTVLKCGPISSVKGQRQKKGIDEIVAGLEQKSVSSKGSSIQRASNRKPVNKIATSQVCRSDVQSKGFKTEDANLALSV